MKKYIYAFLLFGTLVILTTCLHPYDGDDGLDDGLPGTGTPIVVSDLFTQPDNTNNDLYRFYTNDKKYQSSSGYTLWTYCSSLEYLTDRTVMVSKPLGSSIAGYGLILCSDQRMVDGSLGTVFLTVMINNSGQYAIGKVINGSYSHLINWTKGKGLSTGVGLSHKIRIVYLSNNSYQLYLNDISEITFPDDTLPKCEGTGRNGYLVVIAPEDLNNSGVEVWFRKEP